jgi:hypothetical protein
MKYSYKIQVGNSSCEVSFDADNSDSKPTSQMSGSGSPEALTMLKNIMSESSSVSDFEQKVMDHGGTSWIEVPASMVSPSSSTSSSSGMSWGSSSVDEE